MIAAKHHPPNESSVSKTKPFLDSFSAVKTGTSPSYFPKPEPTNNASPLLKIIQKSYSVWIIYRTFALAYKKSWLY